VRSMAPISDALRAGWVRVEGGKRARIADMSLPPQERGRPRRPTRRTRKAVPAIMDHGNHPFHQSRRRDWDRRQPRRA
jgi:hypothetical protein